MNASISDYGHATQTASKAHVRTYHFDAKQVCFCGTGRLFGECCGNSSPDRQPPTHVLVFSDYLCKVERQRMIRYADKQKRSWLQVVDTEKSGKGTTVMRRDPARVTQSVDMGTRQQIIESWFGVACRDKLNGAAIPEWFEPPQMLRYSPGGKYSLHSDAEHFDFEAKLFYRFIDRDFSMLIYLNDDYEGGQLRFPWLNYTYTPKAGDLVIFPSNHVFSHESLPITRGNKYALVSWGAFRGSPRVAMPRAVVRM